LLVSWGCAWLSPTQLFAFRRKPAWAKAELTPGASLNQRFQPLAQTGEAASSLAIHGERLYLGSGPRLLTFDLTDPQRPAQIGQSAALSGAIQRIALPSVGPAYAAVLVEGSGLHLLDLSDPAHPAPLASLELPSAASGIAIQGDLAYLSTAHPAPGYADPQALRSLRVIDLSDPARPRQVALLKMAHNAADIAIQGDYLYYPDRLELPQIANGEGSALHVIDISDPARPFEAAQTDTTPLCPSATSLVIQQNMLYLGAQMGDTLITLCAFDISDPLHPQRLSAWDDAPPIRRLAAAGPRLFAAAEGHLAAIDITNPRAPRLEDLLAAPGAADVAANGNLVYLADSQGGLRVLEFR
jgi:hypothetical protein